MVVEDDVTLYLQWRQTGAQYTKIWRWQWKHVGKVLFSE